MTVLDDLLELVDGMPPDQIEQVVHRLPNSLAISLAERMREEAPSADQASSAPLGPLEQAQELDSGFRERPHLRYLSDRIADAVRRVEDGESVHLRISMPPRMGKSTLGSTYTPAWMLRKHPEWKLGLISHDPALAVSWGRQVRRLIERNKPLLGVQLASDNNAAAEWQTDKDGGVLSRSVGQSVTGRGFKVLIIDDAVKDFADAHSETKRNALWDWWVANAYTRLEPPYLVIAIGTRWHEDDLLGRLQSAEYDGDPDDWEVIEFPAIAEADDVLGRAPGEPLLSPLFEETVQDALKRWSKVKSVVGTYAWSALYQQRPSPAKGAIFDTDWWRYWTLAPQLAAKDEDGNPDPKGRIVLVTEEQLRKARWLDSWDMAFKATSSSDYVVGQRWAQLGANRFLMHSIRRRMTFTQTLTTVKLWCQPHGTPWAELCHERVVEDKANGTAIIDTLKEEVPGMIAINPSDSKEARARAVTPEVEAGNVLLPLPSEPGHEWVTDLVAEARDFPNGTHDDQVDALSQALSRMRTPTKSRVNVPGKNGGDVTSLAEVRRGQAAQTQRRNYGKVARR